MTIGTSVHPPNHPLSPILFPRSGHSSGRAPAVVPATAVRFARQWKILIKGSIARLARAIVKRPHEDRKVAQLLLSLQRGSGTALG